MQSAQRFNYFWWFFTVPTQYSGRASINKNGFFCSANFGRSLIEGLWVVLLEIPSSLKYITFNFVFFFTDLLRFKFWLTFDWHTLLLITFFVLLGIFLNNFSKNNLKLVEKMPVSSLKTEECCWTVWSNFGLKLLLSFSKLRFISSEMECN